MEALVLIAALVALVWGGVFIARGSPLMGTLVYLVVGVGFGHAFYHFDAGTIPLTLDRLVLLLVVAAYAWQRAAGSLPARRPVTADWLILGLVAWIVINATFAGWAGRVAAPYEPFWRAINGYLVPLAVYWIASRSIQGEAQLKLVYGVLAGLGLYLGTTGLLEVTGQWWAVFPSHIGDPRNGIHFGRARGPMVHAVTYGLYTAVCLFGTAILAARTRGATRAVLAGCCLLMLGGIIGCCTRSVWLGTAAAAVVVLAVTLRGAWRPVVLAMVVVGGMLTAMTGMENLASLRREDTAAESRRSVNMRGCFAYVSWHMFLDHPLIGCGFGHFPEAKLPYLSDRQTDLPLESIRDFVHHNTFLSVLVETGLIGLALYVALLASWAHAGWQLYRHSPGCPALQGHGIFMLAVLTLYAAQAMFHELTYSPLDHALPFLVAGITVGLCRTPAISPSNLGVASLRAALGLRQETAQGPGPQGRFALEP